MVTSAASRSTVPSSPTSHYRARREAGSDHERAVAEVQHSYGRNDLAPLLARVRDDYEQAAAPPAPDDAPVHDDHVDAFTVAQNELRARITTLTALRQSLSFDAIADPSKADELAGIEHDLTKAERELERTYFARAESGCRQREADLQAEKVAKEKALQKVSELQVERDQAQAKVNKTASEFARAVARLDGIASEQSQELASVGQSGGWLSPQEVQDTLVRALRAAKVRADWIGTS